MQKIKIAAILTVYNRKQKTLDCLRHLFEAVDAYNKQETRLGDVDVTVFMTDDGCTDGTRSAVEETFRGKDVHIVQGTGSLFWAGGMRLAWQEALRREDAWHYFLLLNDDTNVMENVFGELFEADSCGYDKTGRHGLSSGVTCQPGNIEEITYGGYNFTGRWKGRHTLIKPSGTPGKVDLTHANILLVHADVVRAIGIFHEGYKHSAADQDYGFTAQRRGFPAYVTSHVCGECECDHSTREDEAVMLMNMPLQERKAYINAPTHSDSDYLLMIRRNLPLRYPAAFVLRKIRLYLPSLYYKITNSRGVYKKN